MQASDGEWILIVENEEIVRDLASAILQTERYGVRTAREGAEALSVLDLAQRPPECVILDYAMPGMGGHETLLHLRVAHPELPVLLISGLLRSDVEDRFISVRPDDFLKKPFGPSELLERVRLLVQEGRAGVDVSVA